MRRPSRRSRIALGTILTLAILLASGEATVSAHSAAAGPHESASPSWIRRENASLRLSSELTPDHIQFLAEHEVRRGDPSSGAVALTFDCGFGRIETTHILNILEDYQVRATFFVEGRFVTTYPDLVARIVNAGHEVGNHSLTHPNFVGVDADRAVGELSGVLDALDALADARDLANWIPLRWFRFPYGKRDSNSLNAVAAQGYQSIYWSIDPQGWRSGRTAEQVRDEVLLKAGAGDIVLQHCNSSADADALPEIIEGLKARGLELGTLSDVLRSEDLSPSALQLAPALSPGVKR